MLRKDFTPSVELHIFHQRWDNRDVKRSQGFAQVGVILVIAAAAAIGTYVVYRHFKAPSPKAAIYCAQDVQACPDGSYVKRVPPTCAFQACPQGPIHLDSPAAGSAVSSPIQIKGSAPGNWFFEGVFPIRLYDSQGKIIAQTQAKAQEEWTTKNFVPFSATLDFSVSSEQTGTLVFAKDNPSGLPQNSEEYKLSINLSPVSRTINLYYYNPNLDKDSSGNVQCSRAGLVAVPREIPLTKTPIQDSINLLLQGKLTPQERADGLTTEFPLPGLSLKSASLNPLTRTLTLIFNDQNSATSGGSCRAGILWSQIEATAKQFPGVKSVEFSPADLFQP